MEKQNLTQQKHTFTNQINTNILQHKINTKILKPCLVTLRHPAWKRTEPIVISALHKFDACLLTWTLTTYLQPRIHTGRSQKENGRCDLQRRLSNSAVHPPHKTCLHTMAVEACHDLSCINTFGALAKPLLPIPRYHRYRYTAQLKPTNCNRCTNCPSASVFILPCPRFGR